MSWNFCPHCGGELPPNAGANRSNSRLASSRAKLPEAALVYDQTAHWKSLVARAQAVTGLPETGVLVDRLLRERPRPPFDLPISSIVHVIMDRAVTPAGGVLHEGVVSDG